MEERERYYYDGLGEDIYDSEIDDYPSNETICDTLNQQEKRIKELKNSEDNFCECVSRLQKENKELKEQLDNIDFYKDYCRLKSSSDDLIKGLTEQCQQLKQSQKQLAMNELEELKKEFDSRKLEYKTMENSFHIYGLRIERIFQIIDDQIKELGGGENE